MTRITAQLLVVLLVGLVGYAIFLYLGIPDTDRAAPVPAGAGGPVQWPEGTLPHSNSWSAVQGGTPAPIPPSASTHVRFRLVGTYFMMPGGADAEPVRKAVLDDLQHNTQVLVEEQDSIDGTVVKTIHRDRVVLQLATGQERVLQLLFSEGPLNPPPPDEGNSNIATQAWDEVTLESSRFGRRIAEDRWILSRKELLAYREELLNDPERLASLFISMKADRIDRKIEGYRLERQGEDEFWDSIGLLETDVIRRANSMKMTRQERAEYLISEFVADRLNVVVLDIEREGEAQKLIYYLRE